MYRPRSLLDTSMSDTPESDFDPDAFLTTESSSAEPSPPSSPRHSAAESPATSTAWSSMGQSSATPTYQARRFYHHSSSHSENPLHDPTELYDRIWSRNRAALEESRATALHTIAYCHQVVTTLELARMTATRVGTCIWIDFWNRIYPREWAQPLNAFVWQALRRIDTLFRNTANGLHIMLTEKQNDIRYAATAAQITWELQIMEERALWHRDRRRRKAARIMEKLRANVQNALDVRITPDKMMDMKRGIFGLDPQCDYYPHRLDSGHTAVSLSFPSAEPEPQLTYDPTLDQYRESMVLHNGTWYRVPPGFRPAGNYELDPFRLI